MLLLLLPPAPGGSTGSDNPVLLYLRGLLAWKQESASEGLALLERAIAGQFAAAAELPGASLEMYAVLNPARITGVVRLLLQSIGGEPRAPTEAPSPLISKVRGGRARGTGCGSCGNEIDRAANSLRCCLLSLKTLTVQPSLAARQGNSYAYPWTGARPLLALAPFRIFTSSMHPSPRILTSSSPVLAAPPR